MAPWSHRFAAFMFTYTILTRPILKSDLKEKKLRTNPYFFYVDEVPDFNLIGCDGENPSRGQFLVGGTVHLIIPHSPLLMVLLSGVGFA